MNDWMNEWIKEGWKMMPVYLFKKKRGEYRKWYVSIYLEFINTYSNTFSLMFGNILIFFRWLVFKI